MLQKLAGKLDAPQRLWHRISLRRIIVGGRLGDSSRLRRYLAFCLLGLALIWAPVNGYLQTAPLVFKSHASLILPGSGASASMNLNGIGQASSYANSAFASNSVSPTETYKRLIGADRILAAAAAAMGLTRRDFGKPRIRLVDQTSLIHVEMTGTSAHDAQQRGDALLQAFFEELDALRQDEKATREDSALAAIVDYQRSVAATRRDISQLQKSSGLLSGDEFDAMVEDTRELEGRVESLAAVLQEKTQSVAALEQTLGIPAAAAAATLKLFADADFLALKDESAVHAAKLAQARASYGEGHPKVQAARTAQAAADHSASQQAAAVTGIQFDELKRLDLAPDGARAELLAQLVRMDAERRGTARQHEALTQRLVFEQTRLRRLSAGAARLKDLQRDFSVAEAVFASAIARNQSAKSDVYASYPLVQVLENPSLPERPSSPDRMLAFAAGAAASFMLLVALMLGWIRSAVIGRLLVAPRAEA
ncbi:hypothetical protein AB838_03470 [Rhodobacteraceae bacterium (ex Bugula neritina AB1)]|nr:hypothetical protein AB838_03470 [Rhodobacteraceae bacterium (ex Bugula neritina AB1)]